MEPFGEVRGDLRTGILAATIANTQRDPAVRPDPFSPLDFIPDYWAEIQEEHHQDWKEQLAIVEMINAAMGGKDLRNADSSNSSL